MMFTQSLEVVALPHGAGKEDETFAVADTDRELLDSDDELTRGLAEADEEAEEREFDCTDPS